jgi:cellulose synthase/poly-beta-1,6-N-acetylglucosamine synthase-like glycosyltransferase
MGVIGPIEPALLAAASPAALVTAAAGILWTVTGVLLLVWGWILLPLTRARVSTSSGPPGASRAVRIGVAATIAGLAAVVGTLLLGQGSAFATLEASGFARLIGSDIAVGGFVTDVATGFVRIGTDLAVGFAALGRGLTFGAGFEGQYVAANLAAVAAAVVVGALAGWVSFGSRWRYAGVATYIGLDLMALGFVALSLAVVEATTNPVAAVLGIWLIAVMLFGFFLFLVYQFYAMEHIVGSGDHLGVREGPAPAPDPWPFVLVQVASYNEPPEIVRECIRSVCMLDYPKDRFAVQLCDDSTDRATVRAMEEICTEFSVEFRHRTNRRGFKGGALNDGLAAFAGTVDLIAIVDSDYIVDPGFLVRIVPEFTSPTLAFVQTPQAYRNVRVGGLTRWYELADAYFYRVVQPVRARYQSLIFCGTMGLLRRAALEDAGGWSEECVTEDAELTMRLLARGWRGKYIAEQYGAGLAPDLMSAVRSQQRRWAFGGIQMLRMNRKLLGSQKLTFRQRWDFRLTGLFWFDGLFLVGVAAAVAGLVIASWFGDWLPFAAVPAPAIVAVVPAVLMADGFVKIRAALQQMRDVTYRDVLGVMSFWYAIKINDLRAAIRAGLGAQMPFVRTPKVSSPDPGRWDALKAALRSSTLEAAVALGLTAIVVASLAVWLAPGATIEAAYYVFLVWLVYYAYAFGSAVWFDYQSRLSLFLHPEPKIPSGVRAAPETVHG